jgi:dihydrofolate synthase/folylpolyglutamate synthase
VAGTKGKGSAAAMIASALTAAGYKTGLYTSPHLIDLRERFRVDGQLIPQSAIIELAARLKPEVTAINDEAAYGKLTTFELLTALGFSYFAGQGVDFQVIEAGLGGRLDATNVIDAEVCVITSINLDHTEVLGDSLAAIAAEKAGIIKPGTTVISAPQAEEAMHILEAACREQHANLVRAGRDVTWEDHGLADGRQRLALTGRLGSYRLPLPLLGRYQQENAAVAVAALEVLADRGFNISRQSIIDGLEGVDWPGRFQILGHNPLIIADGAHNPTSARELRKSLEHYLASTDEEYKPRVLVFGTSCDKDIANIVPEFCSFFDRIVVARSRHPRSVVAADIAAEFARHGVDAYQADTVAEGLTQARQLAGKSGLVCVTGSLFVVGEALEVFTPEA